MTSESIPRNSFFDEDDLNLKLEFTTPSFKHQKDVSYPSSISGILFRQLSPGIPASQGFYALHNKTLVYFKDSLSTQPDACLDLSHSRLYVCGPSMTSTHYGFSVQRNGNKFEFFSPDEQVIENWKTCLRSVCVLTNFHDEYKAQKMIGKGSFAKVYLVESKTNGKTFAVKAFTKESVIISNKSNAKPSMWNEIDIMRALDHDYVIRLYEVYETEKSIYLVLELCQGRSLQEILKKGGFKDNEQRAINILSKILEAIAYLSSRGVMHRDLKPDNILIDKLDNIKIVDFGLATFIDVPEYIFKKCGTPGYIAPEVFKYDQKNPATNYDGRCDVFSVGCILYFMLFQTAFFDGSNASEILKVNRKFSIDFHNLLNAKQELRNPASKISKEGLNLLFQLLELDQKARVVAAQALSHPFLISSPTRKNIPIYDYSPSGGSSPSIYDKRGSFAQDLYLQQLKNGSIGNSSPVRFTEKDSLYLDVGKPEITGRIDTLTSGSANNSMLLKTNSTLDSSPLSASKFARASGQNKTMQPQSPHEDFMKASIFRNMQQNPDVEQDSGTLRLKLEEVKNDRRQTDYVQNNFSYYGNQTSYNNGPGNYYQPEEVSQYSTYGNAPSNVNYDKLRMSAQTGNSANKFVEPSQKKLTNFTQQGQRYYDKDV